MMIQERSTNLYSKGFYDNLVGDTVVSCENFEDTDGEPGIWFIYKDLAIRKEGKYYIKFSLFDIGW